MSVTDGATAATEESSGAAPAPDELVVIMIGYQAGDAACFDDLYRHLQSPLRGFLISLTRSVQQADDLLQETFLQLHRSRASYTPPRSVKAWAFGIARNVHLMSRRTAARRREVQQLDEIPIEIPVPSNAGRIADSQLLRDALAHLALEQREAVLLHHVWGFSFPEVARILGTTSGAAKVRVHRAMKKLKGLLE